MSPLILEIRSLTKRFGGLTATGAVDFDLEEGAQEAIIGPNGAGKSTLFGLISGFHRPDAGTIRFQGREITGQKPHLIAQQGVSRAFQVSNIFLRLSVLENIRSAVQARAGHAFDLWRDARTVDLERTEEVLALCRLGEKRAIPAGELSQGDKKKLELALALAGRPRLLLLDEPTAGMSLEETKATMDLVDSLNRVHGLSILFTEHDMSVVFNHARRVTLLHRGQIIFSGTPAEVRANDAVQRIYLGEQA